MLASSAFTVCAWQPFSLALARAASMFISEHEMISNTSNAFAPLKYACDIFPQPMMPIPTFVFFLAIIFISFFKWLARRARATCRVSLFIYFINLSFQRGKPVGDVTLELAQQAHAGQDQLGTLLVTFCDFVCCEIGVTFLNSIHHITFVSVEFNGDILRVVCNFSGGYKIDLSGTGR